MKPSAEIDKKIVFENLSHIAQAIAAPARMRILQVLSNKPSGVEELSEKIKESIANTSQHLQKLKKAGVVIDSRQGVSRTYSLTTKDFIDIFLELQELASRISPELKVAEERLCPDELLPHQSLAEIIKLVGKKRATLLDVRDYEEYESSSAPMSIFFPRDEIKKNLKLISKSKPVYVYCRGRYCALANDVVKELRKQGYKAFRLKQMAYEIQKIFKKPA